MEILIRGGRVLDPASQTDEIMDLLIKDGKIAQIKAAIQGSYDKEIHAEGCWVTPGLIDLHVHFREPGFEHKENILTGSRAAAAGGFTTVCCMPNTNPVIDNEIVAEYVNLKAERAGIIHVLPVGAITKGQKGEELADIGKMAGCGVRAISEDGKTVENAGLLKTAMKYAGMFGMVVMSHCEDASLKAKGQMNAGEQAAYLGLPGISNDSEDIIVARDIILGESSGVRLHICHVSTEGSVQLIREAKARGIKVTAEVCPHHFTLTDKDITGYDGNYKMSPPLRSGRDVEAMKAGLKDGTIDCIATDHAPHHYDEKNCEFELAQNGIVGLETSVGLSITELVKTGLLTPMELVKKMAYNPGKIIGRGGALAVGEAADVTIIDPRKKYRVDVENFYSKAKNSPFHGRELTGKVEYTICGGRIVVENGLVREEYNS